MPNPQLTPYSEWIRSTNVFGATRSTELKALDRALEAYDLSRLKTDAELKAVRDAFEAWKKKQAEGGKGPDAWMRSSRKLSMERDVPSVILDGATTIFGAGAGISGNTGGSHGATATGLAISCGRINKMCTQAAEYFRNRGASNAIHQQPDRFNAWYRDVVHVPALAIVPLLSGVCGDKMVYLSMFAEGTSEPITADEFQAGARFLDDLKNWGAKYLTRANYEFSSSDEVVTGLLKRHNCAAQDTFTTGGKWRDRIMKIAYT